MDHVEHLDAIFGHQGRGGGALGDIVDGDLASAGLWIVAAGAIGAGREVCGAFVGHWADPLVGWLAPIGVGKGARSDGGVEAVADSLDISCISGASEFFDRGGDCFF